MPVEERMIVSLTLAGTNKRLSVAKANEQVATDHFTFCHTHNDDHDSLFILEHVDGMFTIQAASNGRYIALTDTYAAFSTTKSLFTIQQEGECVRVMAPGSRYLSCLSLGDYCVLGSNSILPQRTGLLVLNFN
jgi:hypothetical protein